MKKTTSRTEWNLVSSSLEKNKTHNARHSEELKQQKETLFNIL